MKGRRGLFPLNVHWMSYESTNNIQTFASALSRGAFPGLDNLTIRNGSLLGAGMATLSQALLTAPWGEQLWRLQLKNCGMEAEDARVLADVFQQGGLSSVQEIVLKNNNLGDQGVIYLANGFKISRHSLLRRLYLEPKWQLRHHRQGRISSFQVCCRGGYAQASEPKLIQYKY